MDLQYNKTDSVVLPITNTRISASEYNQIAGSLMQIITSAGLTTDAGDNTQLLNAVKSFIGRTVIETYSNGTSWYRIWSDGWCEQGGTRVATSTWETLTFLKSFINTNYTALISNSAGGNTTNSIRNKTATSMQIYQNVQYDWQACGYIR